jgi:hypothetical protein
MKSTEVYKEINKIISPNLKSNGFKKTKSGMLGFYKQLKENFLVIWFQCSQEGFDKYAGSKFIIEIQVSKTNQIGDISVVRNRIPFFLNEKELDIIAKTEVEIKNKLRTPPASYFFGLGESTVKWYLNKFNNTRKAYSKSSDIWFVYSDQADVVKWVSVVEPIITRIISDFENTDY